MRIEPNQVNSISVNDIAMIKVIKGPAGLLTSSGGGNMIRYLYTSRKFAAGSERTIAAKIVK